MNQMLTLLDLIDQRTQLIYERTIVLGQDRDQEELEFLRSLLDAFA